MKLFPIAALSLVLLSACRLEPIERSEETVEVEGGAPVEMEFFASDQHRARGLPFSEGVRVGDMIYLSGMLGRSPETRQLVEGGIQAETRQSLENISAELERFGSSMERVAKCTVILADIGEFSAMNEVYAEFFPREKPARTGFEAAGLAAGARVEIECWAAVG